jgi:hypothetical protein
MNHKQEIEAIFSKTTSSKLYHDYGASQTQDQPEIEPKTPDSLSDLFSDFTDLNKPIIYSPPPQNPTHSILPDSTIPTTSPKTNLIPHIPESTMSIHRSHVRMMKRPSPPPPVDIPVLTVKKKSPRRMIVQNSRNIIAMEGLMISGNGAGAGRRVIPSIGSGGGRQ